MQKFATWFSSKMCLKNKYHNNNIKKTKKLILPKNLTTETKKTINILKNNPFKLTVITA